MSPRRPAVPAPLLVLGAVVSVQLGQAFGKWTFQLVGPFSVAALRLSFAAAVLLAVCRPSLRRDRRSWLLAAGFGTSIAGMNLVYPALVHIPVGMAASLMLLGPLTVALLGSRRVLDACWSLLAALGVGLFYLPGGAAFSLPGVLFALGGATSMGAYLLLSRRAGAHAADGSVLALAVSFAAILSLPLGVRESGADLLQGHVLLAGLALAVVSAVIPYSLELVALRTLPPRVVGTLESLEPVAGGLAGLAVLGEVLASSQWAAIACVSAASVGAVATRRSPAHRAGAARGTAPAHGVPGRR